MDNPEMYKFRAQIFGINLRRAMLSQGISCGTLAIKTGLACVYIRQIVTGARCNPSLQVMTRLADAVHSTVDELTRDI